MSERRLCGKCERIYSEAEAKVEFREAPPEAPIRWEGVTKIKVLCCPYCGAPENDFYPDSQWNYRFNRKTSVSTPFGELVVSTVNLMIEHYDGFFETMIFPGKGFKAAISPDFCERYWTKEEAIKGHEKVVQLLKEGKFKLEPTEYRLILGE